jgi:hypothetical protein
MTLLLRILLFALFVFSVTPWANESSEIRHNEKTTSINSHSDKQTDIESNVRLERFLARLKIKQGIARFTQKKHLSFLANPIVSKGLLKIYQNSVIWHVQSPVFSKLVIVDDQIWQLTDKNASNYQIVVSHASVETLIRAVFTGDISQSQWHSSLDEKNCLQLSPNDLILSQAITQLSVCVDEDEAQRFVSIKDAQNNVTEIELTITTELLSDDDIREFVINP